jgi:hypothetical protein
MKLLVARLSRWLTLATIFISHNMNDLTIAKIIKTGGRQYFKFGLRLGGGGFAGEVAVFFFQ